jgi:two-component system chemotaxis response regulator CheY
MTPASNAPRPLRVLLLDESALLRAMLKRVLQISGLPLDEVIEAAKSDAAFETLDRQPIDAVFANLDPAQAQGHDLLSRLPEHPRASLLIAVSTRGFGSSREELDRLGVSGFVNAPFRPEDIRDVLVPLFRRA